MSFSALQRVAVRMLLDPSFAAAVFKAPEESLSGLTLSAEERSWLTQSDHRAWQLDPMRRTRTLQALLEEFPVSAALVFACDGDARRLDAFLSSKEMHEAIQSRGRLNHAFGVYLMTLSIKGTPSVIQIEAALARCRLPPDPVAPSAPLMLSHGHLVLPLPEGSLEHYVTNLKALQAHATRLATSLLAALLSDTLELPRTEPPQGEETCYLLIEPSPTGPGIGEVSAPLGMLLLRAQEGATRHTLERVAEELGAEGQEARELIDELIAEGLITSEA